MEKREPVCYLAGPITKLSYNEAVDWRENAKAQLATFGIKAVSPMRAKNFLKGLNEMPSDNQAQALDRHGIGLPKGFVTRDHMDVKRADVILMNLFGAKQVSIGTMTELGWASAYGKPVVLVIEADGSNIHEHGFVRTLTSYHNTDIQTAIETVAALLVD